MKATWGVLAGLLFTASAFAQGQVVFANTASTQFRIWTNNPAGTASNLNSTTLNRFGLYAAQGSPSSNSLTLVGVAMALTASPSLYGFFNGGNPFAMPAPFAPGDTITFQIRGWSGNFSSYEQAIVAQQSDPLNIALGVSPLGTTTLTASPAPPAPLFGTSPGLISRGFEVKAIPEPSTFALAALGAFAVAFCCRRRKRV